MSAVVKSSTRGSFDQENRPTDRPAPLWFLTFSGRKRKVSAVIRTRGFLQRMHGSSLVALTSRNPTFTNPAVSQKAFASMSWRHQH